MKTAMKKIIVISTSLRNGSNSDQLADKFIQGAMESGNSVEKISLINKEINRKRTEFNLEILPIGSTLADKRINQALELIGENNGQYDAVISACENKDIDEIRAAAAALTGTDETTVQIVRYLNDAADALESYLD